MSFAVSGPYGPMSVPRAREAGRAIALEVHGDRRARASFCRFRHLPALDGDFAAAER